MTLESAAGRELLDDPLAPAHQVHESLRHIARANRLFGGAAAVRWGLRTALAGVPRGITLTLLDVGTGLGDLPRMARQWVPRFGVEILPFGLDRHPAAARLAAESGLVTLVGSGDALPMRSGSVDLVLMSQVVHHFGRNAVVRLLRECNRVARRAVIVADLRRSRAAAFGFSMAARLLGFDEDTRRDGVTSLDRGYSVQSFEQLLREAGLRAQVVRRLGARLVAVWTPAA
jgi:ubiquinone/menaquinone biosynthesis C-methylase UbiE